MYPNGQWKWSMLHRVALCISLDYALDLVLTFLFFSCKLKVRHSFLSCLTVSHSWKSKFKFNCFSQTIKGKNLQFYKKSDLDQNFASWSHWWCSLFFINFFVSNTSILSQNRLLFVASSSSSFKILILSQRWQLDLVSLRLIE